MLTYTNGWKQQGGRKKREHASHAFEQSYKCQKVTDTKSRNASHMYNIAEYCEKCKYI